MKLPVWVALAGGIVVLYALQRMGGMSQLADSANFPKSINERKRNNARIIEQAVRAAGFDDRVVKAAIVNAWRESELNEAAVGDKGSAIGLFQVHPWGGSKEFRADASNNVALMLQKEALANTWFGKKFREVVNSGGSAEDVAEAWTRFLERPAHKDAESAKSRALVRQFWGG